jgi:hypothetical protein
MARKYLKAAGMAAVVLGGSFGVAQAAPPTPPPAPSELVERFWRQMTANAAYQRAPRKISAYGMMIGVHGTIA